jgi:predicted nucleic acid-binding protein
MIVVSDTSPLSCLIKTKNLFLLERLFGEIIVPPAVYRETLELKSFKIDLSEFESASWIKKYSPQNLDKLKDKLSSLDEGEAEAIALAIELKANLILIDERGGFNKARELGLAATGLLGVVLFAKEKGIITSGKQLIDQFISEGGMWVGPNLYKQVIQSLNEK